MLSLNSWLGKCIYVLIMHILENIMHPSNLQRMRSRVTLDQIDLIFCHLRLHAGTSFNSPSVPFRESMKDVKSVISNI